MDDAAASGDATDVATSPARKPKRKTMDGESIASILVWASDMIIFFGTINMAKT